MKKLTLKAFINQTNIPDKLIRATVRQASGDWELFKESAADIANYGASGGYGGFIYYSDTVPFAKRNLKEIIELAEQQAAEFGESDAYAMIAGFNCLKKGKLTGGRAALAIAQPNNDQHVDVMNALAWYALEEVAREVQRAMEE